MRGRAYRIAFVRGGLIVLAATLLYLWLAPPYFVTGDNAEMAAAGARGGVPHPSGYALYVVVLRALSWLPGSSAAHTTAIATALIAGAQLWILHAACRAWGASPAAATIAIAIYAAGPVVMRGSTEGDVFALNNLIVALVLWLAADAGPLRGARRAVALAIVAGLGLSNHLTCGMVAPIGLLGAVRGIREATMPKLAVVGLAIVGLVVGLTPYLYLLVPPHNDLAWGNIDNLGALWNHIMRMDYGGVTTLAAHAQKFPASISELALLHGVARGWLWAPLALGLGVLAIGIARPAWLGDDAPATAPAATPARARESRWAWAMLAASLALAGPVLAWGSNVLPEGTLAWAIERFDMLPLLLLALPIAVGFDAIAARLVRIPALARLELARSLPAVSLLALVVGGAAAASSLDHVARIHSPAVEMTVHNIFESLPPNAVMIAVSDEIMFGGAYEQEVLGVRRDVLPISWAMMPLPWYRERIARHGLTIPEHHDGPASVAIAEEVLASGRPLFIDMYGAAIAKAFATYPYGVLYRVVPRGTAPPSLDEILQINRAVFAKYDLAYPKPGPDDGFATDVHVIYAEVWSRLADALARAGRLDDAAFAQDVSRQLAPTP